MSRLLGRSGRLAAVAAAVVAMSLSSVVLASPMASSSTIASKSTSTILKLDHFLCYHVVARGFKPPSHILLKNWLQPIAFVPVLGVTSTHCNPANKQVSINGAVKTYKVLHPNSHLLCWQISYKFGARPVFLSNQFGKGVMTTTGGPTSLCVPSWKKRAGPPNKSLTAPTNLDHFACYPLLRPAPSPSSHFPRSSASPTSSPPSRTSR